MGVKVTLRRVDQSSITGEVITSTFDNATGWIFAEEEGVRTLRIKGDEKALGAYVSEFLADAVESVEFV